MVLKPSTTSLIITCPTPGTTDTRAESSDPALKEVRRIQLRAQTDDQWLGRQIHFGCDTNKNEIG